jgi:hypothetical protein
VRNRILAPHRDLEDLSNSSDHRLRSIVLSFHREETGATVTTEKIVLLFVAVLIIAALFAFFNSSIFAPLKTKICTLLNTTC